jgi:LacI family transcriptional regulator
MGKRFHGPRKDPGILSSGATIVDIAGRANVSPATVSRAIRSVGRVDPRTRQRILSIALDMGYRVNRSAQSLRTRRTMMLGLVLPETYGIPFYASVADHLNHAVSDHGYLVIQCLSQWSPEKERGYIEDLLLQRIDGLILLKALSRSNLSLLKDANVPHCHIERPAELVREFGGVLVDHTLGVQEGVDYLISLGQKEIHYVGTQTSDSADPIEDERIKGFRDAMTAASLEVTPGMIHLTKTSTIEAGRELARRVVVSSRKPTALFVLGDVLSIGLLQELYTRNVRVPQDISITSFEDSWGSHVVPPLTRIQMPAKECAYAAVDMILEQITNPAGPRRHEIIKPQLLVGESTRAL